MKYTKLIVFNTMNPRFNFTLQYALRAEDGFYDTIPPKRNMIIVPIGHPNPNVLKTGVIV